MVGGRQDVGEGGRVCSLEAESQNDSKKQEYTRHREFHGDSYAWSKEELSRGAGGIDEGH